MRALTIAKGGRLWRLDSTLLTPFCGAPVFPMLMSAARNTITIGEATGTVQEIYENGDRLIEFDRVVDEKSHGHLALPPYMHRQDRERRRYDNECRRSPEHEAMGSFQPIALHV